MPSGYTPLLWAHTGEGRYEKITARRASEILAPTPTPPARARRICPSSSSCSSFAAWLPLLCLLRHLRQIPPEVVQRLHSSKQRSKYSGVSEQDVPGTVSLRRHPEKHIELAISRLYERMWPGHLDRLSGQNVN